MWGHDAILADVVWVIRRFQPDVIITRFPTNGSAVTGITRRRAMLAGEAFAAAADPKRFPEQLAPACALAGEAAHVERRCRSECSPTSAGGSSISAPTDPLLGRSYTEIAGESRSKHKSQGFGAAERRGTALNYLAAVAGDPASTDLFDGIDLRWARLPGGAAVDAALAAAERRLDPEHPAGIVPDLARAWRAMAALPPGPLVEARRAELADVMRSCAGLWLEAVSREPQVAAGGRAEVATMALARGGAAVTLARVELRGGESRATPRVLADNVPLVDTLGAPLPPGPGNSQPYWLQVPAARGMFRVADPAQIGQPENAPVLVAHFEILMSGARVPFDVPVAYRWTDPVLGERWRALEVVPRATLALDEAVYVFPDAAPRAVAVTVTAVQSSNGAVRLELPAGWSAVPREVPLTLAAGEEGVARFRVTPADPGTEPVVRAVFEVEGERFTRAARAHRSPAHPRADPVPAGRAHGSCTRTSGTRRSPWAT